MRGNTIAKTINNDINVIGIVEKMNRMQVAMYLKQKKETIMTDEDRFEWISKIKMFSKAYDVDKSLISVMNELLDSFRL